MAKKRKEKELIWDEEFVELAGVRGSEFPLVRVTHIRIGGGRWSKITPQIEIEAEEHTKLEDMYLDLE
jgi:hypothetical protein